jgi:hypothetical protein
MKAEVLEEGQSDPNAAHQEESSEIKKIVIDQSRSV